MAPTGTVVLDLSARQAGTPAEWHDLPFGVRIKLRAETGLAAAAVQAEVGKALYGLSQGQSVLGRFGFDEDQAGLLGDEKIAGGFAMFFSACIRAELLIEEWNLTDPEGAPIPITVETASGLFDHGPQAGAGAVLMAEFLRLCDAPRQARLAEGNVSGSSANGATAGEPNTAKGAGRKALPARMAASPKAPAARSSKTRRKPPTE